MKTLHAKAEYIVKNGEPKAVIMPLAEVKLLRRLSIAPAVG